MRKRVFMEGVEKMRNNYCKFLSNGMVMVNSRYVLEREDAIVLFPDLDIKNTKEVKE